MKNPTSLCERNSSCLANKQLRSNFMLKNCKIPAEHGLCHPKRFCRSCHTA